MKHFFYILLLNILAISASGQVYQNESVYGRRVNRVLVDSTLRIPIGLSTKTASIVDSVGMIALKDTVDGVYFFTGERWKQLSGGGGGGVDSFYYRLRLVDSSYYVFDRSDGIVDTVNFAAAAAGGDTTIFKTVIDSTGQPGNPVLFAGGNKIRSDSYFLYDSVNNKLVINHNNISVGGPSTKLFVKGNVVFTDQLALQGNFRNDYAINNPVDDSTTYKPLAIDGSGNVRQFDYWPASGGGGSWGSITGTLSDQTDLQAALDAKLNISDTAAMQAGEVRAALINWPGTLYTTPTLASLSGHTLTFAPSLASQSAYTLFGNNTGSTAAPTFFTNNFSDSLRRSGVNVQRRVNGNWITQYTDSVGGGGGGSTKADSLVTKYQNISGSTSGRTYTADDSARIVAYKSAAGSNQFLDIVAGGPGGSGPNAASRIRMLTAAQSSGIIASRLVIDSNGNVNISGDLTVGTFTSGIINFAGTGTLLGNNAGVNNSSATTGNTFVGYHAGNAGGGITNTNNTFIGKNAGAGFTLWSGAAYNVGLGADLPNLPTITGSNQFQLGGNSVNWLISDVSGSNRRWAFNGTTTTISSLTASASLEITGTGGGLLIPRLTTTQKNAVSSPATGLQVYDTDLKSVGVYDATAWRQTPNGISGSATLDFGNTSAQTSAELTITVTGAADGDVVMLGIPNAASNANSTYTARVSATNTVSVKFNNYSTGSIDPSSGTFKVYVIKN